MDTVNSQGIVGSDQQNMPDVKGIHTVSTFGPDSLGYEFLATMRFGEISPFTFMEMLPKDKDIEAQFKHTVDSYTLKAPLMQDIKIKKMVCQVPREAILPLNWEKWFKNPVIGQDVPDDVGTCVYGFWHKAYQICNGRLTNFQTMASSTQLPTDINASMRDTLRMLVLLEMFYSNGNLLRYCGISGAPWFYMLDSTGQLHHSYDEFFDKVCNHLIDNMSGTGIIDFYVTIGNTIYGVCADLDPDKVYGTRLVTVRQLLCLLRDELVFTVTNMNSTVFGGFQQDLYNDTQIQLATCVDDTAADPDKEPVDLKRLWAYQLVCAHFMTNDKVDFIYTAELFRQYINQLTSGTSTVAEGIQKFTVNGLTYIYDAMSAMNFNRVADQFTNPGSGTFYPSINECYGYLCALLSFRRSLRYLDYYTGAKTQPLAVGNVNVQVNNGYVNVIDTQAKTFLARMLNAINRSGMRNYVEEIFNVRQAPDWHNPQYLIKMDDVVFASQVENTGDAQWQQPNSVTSKLNGNSNRYAFKMDFDRSSILVGVCWFDIKRLYSYNTERQNMHLNRFDEFQPYMQYTGDQKLYKAELGTPLIASNNNNPMDAFGYKLRNCEYKERISMCAGGFVENLPGYAFKADVLELSMVTNIGPTFIRSLQSELDKFYLSLSGYSLANYFHFICRFENIYSGKRPMAFAPTLL